ncbi:hypothetical protein CFP56_015506 [Quercus suber]|uniref:Uncharacterized protein n=1 Tax=Quercus suber TaxID=58331 RepID=A0AAW0KS73_QUESU
MDSSQPLNLLFNSKPSRSFILVLPNDSAALDGVPNVATLLHFSSLVYYPRFSSIRRCQGLSLAST